MTTRFSKIQWGDGLTVTPDDDDPNVIRVDGTGGPAGATGPAGPAGPAGPTGPPGADGVGVPAGGTDGQVLTKASGADYDTDWETPTAGGGAPTGAAGGALDGTYPNPGLNASVAGAGLSEAADVLAVNVDNTTIEIVSDTVRVRADGITATQIAAGAVGSSELADTAVTPGTYGDSTHVAQVTVDADGRLTTAANVAITSTGGGGASPTDTQAWLPLTTTAPVASPGLALQTPAGTIDGANTTFTLSQAPSPAANLLLFKNGLAMTQPGDYTISGTTITFVTAPATGSILLAAVPSTSSDDVLVFDANHSLIATLVPF